MTKFGALRIFAQNKRCLTPDQGCVFSTSETYLAFFRAMVQTPVHPEFDLAPAQIGPGKQASLIVAFVPVWSFFPSASWPPPAAGGR